MALKMTILGDHQEREELSLKKKARKSRWKEREKKSLLPNPRKKQKLRTNRLGGKS